MNNEKTTHDKLLTRDQLAVSYDLFIDSFSGFEYMCTSDQGRLKKNYNLKQLFFTKKYFFLYLD